MLAFFIFVLCLVSISGFVPNRTTNKLTLGLGASTGGNRWDEFNSCKPKVLGPLTLLKHLGDVETQIATENDVDKKKKADFNLNVVRALETLRKELPMVFYISNIDFSIFANQITVADGNQNRLMMQKSLYIAAVKSLHMAAAFSTIYPSINVRKIEYIEDCRTIQCLVDVVLPDSVRVDGQVSIGIS